MRKALLTVLFLASLSAAAACGTDTADAPASGVGAGAPASAGPPAAPPDATAPQPGRRSSGAPPTHVRIPAIDVDSPLVDLGMDAAGALVPPAATDVAGWFSSGPRPGDPGPALLAGHVDSRAGPGVFYRLAELELGDRIDVQRSDGSLEAFVVSHRTQVSKAAFPTDVVYGPTPGPELRLVTCGGTFDRSEGSYRDNIVVEAVAADAGWTIG